MMDKTNSPVSRLCGHSYGAVAMKSDMEVVVGYQEEGVQLRRIGSVEEKARGKEEKEQWWSLHHMVVCCPLSEHDPLSLHAHKRSDEPFIF